MPKQKNTETPLKETSSLLPKSKLELPTYKNNSYVAFTFFTETKEKGKFIPFVITGKVIGMLMQLEQDPAAEQVMTDVWFYTIAVEDITDEGETKLKKFIVPQNNILSVI